MGTVSAYLGFTKLSFRYLHQLGQCVLLQLFELLFDLDRRAVDWLDAVAGRWTLELAAF
eukprot:m.153357 g.153357  ORF g.153357 m.153357 type:complete len:59 (+) comp14348_c1_seq1:473-649(+)